MEILKNLLDKALKKDLQIKLYNYDDELKEYLTITFNHLDDITNNLASIHFDEKNKDILFYFHEQPKNKQQAQLVKNILYYIADKQKQGKNNKTQILKLFEEHETKTKQIYLIKYSYKNLVNYYNPQPETKNILFCEELGALFKKYNILDIETIELNKYNNTIKKTFKTPNKTETIQATSTAETTQILYDIITKNGVLKYD